MKRLAFGLSTLGFVGAVHQLVLGFFSPARLLPGGLRLDQGFYLWAIERAIRNRHYSRFVMNCDWSEQNCFDLRAVPQEWNSLFLVGTIGRWLRVDALQTVFS